MAALSEPWLAIYMSVVVLALAATLWAFEAGEWLHRRDARSLREAIAASMIAIACLGLLALSLQRAGVITFDARVWLTYITRGALLMGLALLVSVRFWRP